MLGPGGLVTKKRNIVYIVDFDLTVGRQGYLQGVSVLVRDVVCVLIYFRDVLLH